MVISQWSTTGAWMCSSCLFCSSEHSQKDRSLRRYHFTRMLWGSNSAAAACAAQGGTARTGKGAVRPLFLGPEMLYLPSDSLCWSRGRDTVMRHQWDTGCLPQPKGVQIRLPCSHEGALSDSFWLVWVGHLLSFLLKPWCCAGGRLSKGDPCCSCSSYCDGDATLGSRVLRLSCWAAYVFHVKAFIDKTSCSLKKNIARKGCWLHIDEGFCWKVYRRNNFSVFGCLK